MWELFHNRVLCLYYRSHRRLQLKLAHTAKERADGSAAATSCAPHPPPLQLGWCNGNKENFAFCSIGVSQPVSVTHTGWVGENPNLQHLFYALVWSSSRRSSFGSGELDSRGNISAAVDRTFQGLWFFCVFVSFPGYLIRSLAPCFQGLLFRPEKCNLPILNTEKSTLIFEPSLKLILLQVVKVASSQSTLYNSHLLPRNCYNLKYWPSIGKPAWD